MGDNYKDYSRQPTHVDRSDHPSAEHEYGGNTRGEPGEKNWADMTTKDLERAAQDNHDRPLGTLVGDWRVKEKEGPEEGYIGGTSAFGAPPVSDLRNYAENERGDVGRAYGQPEDDAYYGGSRSGRQSAFSQAYTAEDRYSYEPQGRQQQDFFSKTDDRGFDPDDTNFVNDVPPRPAYRTLTFYERCWLTGFQIGSFIGTTLAFNMIVIMSLVVYVTNKLNPLHKSPPRAKVEKEYEERITGERFSTRAAYYANYWGYDCEDIDVETEDGFILRLHHLTSKKHEKRGHPVILQHGILSTSVTFMVNEERSLAFWLLEQGYDVWLSNIRTNFKMPHRHYSRADPRYWAWTVKEIGLYDLPAIVDYVGKETGLKPAYIGHSQGCGTMYLALSRGMRPDLGNKISCFISLAPAVYAGPALRHFPFSLMRKFAGSRKVWKLVFGVREFIPAIGILQAVLPGWLFGHFANPTFAFIFGFHDHNWVKRQIPKFFRTVAVPNSSELLLYMNVFAGKNCVFDTRTTEPWFPTSMPPLAIFYGTLDTLVLGKPLVERIRSHEPNVRLVKAVALENYEHQDPIWAHTAIKEVYPGIREVIEETRYGYKRGKHDRV
ncbi:cholesterol esterase [Rhodotorula toruloides]